MSIVLAGGRGNKMLHTNSHLNPKQARVPS